MWGLLLWTFSKQGLIIGWCILQMEGTATLTEEQLSAALKKAYESYQVHTEGYRPLDPLLLF